MKKITIGVLTLGIISIFAGNSTSALTYEKTINPTFVINDTLTISLSSSDLVINDLAPGNASDSNIITINILSNNPYGYTLTSNVGNSTYNNRNLTNTSATTATPFTSLDYGSSVSSLNDFSSNQWGYSYSDQTVSTPTWSNYSGLPLYTDTTNITTLKESDTTSANTGDNIEFKIAAKADTAQVAGEYKNIINFIATGNPKPPTRYMQDLTLEECQNRATEEPITVYDKRDESDYTVRYINGGCWMTQNLRITGTISAEDSNFTGDDFNVSEYSLDANDASYTNHCDNTNGYNYACAKDSGNDITGVWYNFYSTSAGTIKTDSDTTPATSDICPSNWHLPTGPNTTPNTDFNILIGNTISGWQTATTGVVAFNAAAGGHYYDGLRNSVNGGLWWSTAIGNATNRYAMDYYSIPNHFKGDGNETRSYGFFVRCVRIS